MPAIIDGGASVACSAWGVRGRPRNVMPNAFAKQAAARPPVSASHFRGPAEEGLEGEPLADEPVERGEGRDRDGSKQEQPSRPGHAPGEPAEFLHVADVRAAEDAACAEEEEAFECRVVDGVKECGGKRDRREGAARNLPTP